jgi:hypothetical protein
MAAVPSPLSWDVYVTAEEPIVSDWLAALRTIESLNPKAVVAGHKRATRADDPRILGETSQYIRDVDRIAETAATARKFYDEVLELHPGRLDPGALWTTAHTIKP